MKAPMRTLVLIPDLRVRGGVSHYFATLRLDTADGVDYFFVNRPDTVGTFHKVRHLPRIYFSFLWRLPRYGLVHVNPSLDPKSFYRDAVFILLSKLLGKSCLVFFRGWADRFEEEIQRRFILRWIFRQTYARADACIVLGRIFGDKLRGLGVSPQTPIHIETTVAGSEGLTDDELKQKIQDRSNGLHVLFLSRIVQRKGILIALDAFAQCKASHSSTPMHLWVAGDGEFLEEAREYARSRHYTDVTFLGNVTGAEKREILNRCHVLLFPTYFGEGLPNAILECMLHGMAVISRPAGGIPEVIEHGIHGFLSPSVDSTVFAAFLGDLIEDPVLLAQMAEANVKVARERFVAGHVRERILSLYGELMAAHQSKSGDRSKGSTLREGQRQS